MRVSLRSLLQNIVSFLRSLLQNIVSFIGLFSERERDTVSERERGGENDCECMYVRGSDPLIYLEYCDMRECVRVCA